MVKSLLSGYAPYLFHYLDRLWKHSPACFQTTFSSILNNGVSIPSGCSSIPAGPGPLFMVCSSRKVQFQHQKRAPPKWFLTTVLQTSLKIKLPPCFPSPRMDRKVNSKLAAKYDHNSLETNKKTSSYKSEAILHQTGHVFPTRYTLALAKEMVKWPLERVE